jgi:transglutaminase-like putative cysteine protease
MSGNRMGLAHGASKRMHEGVNPALRMPVDDPVDDNAMPFELLSRFGMTLAFPIDQFVAGCMTIISVRHVTIYRYKQPMAFGEHRIMFRPRDSYDQKLIEASLSIQPEPARIRWIHDPFGNCVAIASFTRQACELRFECNIRLDHAPMNAPDFQIEKFARTYPFSYAPDELPDLLASIERRYPDPERKLERWARKFLRQGQPTGTGELLKTLTYGIKESFAYGRRVEGGTFPPLTTLRIGRGSCRDLALLMIEALRCLGLAARFVSGYIYIPDRDRPVLLGGGSTHAWCQVYLPGAGWIELDPTNGIIGNRDLIRVAVARDPAQAIPLTGTFFGNADDELGMSVEVQVSTAETRDGSTFGGPDARWEKTEEDSCRIRDRRPTEGRECPSRLSSR